MSILRLEYDTVNALSVGLCCASIAPSIPQIRLLEVRKYIAVLRGVYKGSPASAKIEFANDDDKYCIMNYIYFI